MQSARTLVSLVVLSTLCAGAAVLAQAPPPPGPWDGHGPGAHRPPGPPDPVVGIAGRILGELDLTQAQRDDVRAIIRSRSEDELRGLVDRFMEARHALEVRIWDPGSTEADIEEAMQAVADRQRDLELGRRRMALDVLAALPESERESFVKRLAETPPPMPPPPPRPPRGPGR